MKTIKLTQADVMDLKYPEVEFNIPMEPGLRFCLDYKNNFLRPLFKKIGLNDPMQSFHPLFPKNRALYVFSKR